MTRLTWSDLNQRFFETGLDRGVFYGRSPEAKSQSAITFATGSRTFTYLVPMTKPFPLGAPIRAQDRDGHYMLGFATTSSLSAITINVTEVGGTDPFPSVNTWTLTNLDIAVPWNGLTGVDEGGAESGASYYVDGRPFLFLPKPKEFTATLKAYTYPDEFSTVMGVVEATDGMYLDSQMGDMFDLCYRTLIGDPISGTAVGYKIHIVYNCVVTPSNIGYESVGADVNPLEFSWEIQAVPLTVAGYRPTAHIIIDTRHMDPDRLAEIEDILYGTSTTPASVSTPQVLFDTLSYGDAIIITDNGDGTWEALGSYHNIYLIGDGVFQIDNVNSVDHGDGTYTVSSTP